MCGGQESGKSEVCWELQGEHEEGETGWGSAEATPRALKSKLRSLHLIPQVMGSLLSTGFETFLKRAGNSLGNPSRTETAAGLRTCRSLSPAGTGMWALGFGPALLLTGWVFLDRSLPSLGHCPHLDKIGFSLNVC